MKKYSNMKYQLLFLALIMLGVSSCTDKFLDYNTNSKEGATEEEMSRDDYKVRASLKTLQTWVVPVDHEKQRNTFQFLECLLGGPYGGYMADANPGWNERSLSTYNAVDGWMLVAFNDVIPEVTASYNDVVNTTEDPILRSVASIVKVISLSRVTDIYGPIPYSRIGEDGKLNAPYDSQEEVYVKMFEELDNAIQVLSANRTSDFSPFADRIYGGKVENWIKFANSHKLRMAMRIADVKPDLAKQKAEEVANDPVGAFASNADNATILGDQGNLYMVTNYEYGNGGDHRISADITSYMNGYNDPRREKYFTLSTFSSGNGYHGLRVGITIPVATISQQYSNILMSSNVPTVLMNAAEVSFLKAEGALRGWSMGGTAQSFYENGIRLSFEQTGAAGADNYLNNSILTPQAYVDPRGVDTYGGVPSSITIKWSDTDTFDKKLERIITQKWIAIFPLGIEAWSEYRRTGYPKLMEVKENKSGGTVDSRRMARRLPYPQSEYSTNSVNVNDAVNKYLGGRDNQGVDVWWAKKN